jgi:hypothetical protein
VQTPRRNSSWFILLCSLVLLVGLGLTNLASGQQDGGELIDLTLDETPSLHVAGITLSAPSGDEHHLTQAMGLDAVMRDVVRQRPAVEAPALLLVLLLIALQRIEARTPARSGLVWLIPKRPARAAGANRTIPRPPPSSSRPGSSRMACSPAR